MVREDNTFESLLEGLSAVLQNLKSDQTEEVKETYSELVLPPPESLLIQFSGRQVYSSVDAMNDRLTSTYWLSLPTTDESDGDVENVRFSNINIFCNCVMVLFLDSL